MADPTRARGIVWVSTSTDEYEEVLLKARVLTESPPQFSLLETMLWTPEEGFFLREKHITRLLDSVEYFDFPLQSRYGGGRVDEVRIETPLPTRPPEKKEILETYLNEIAASFTSPQRVRLLLNKNGQLTHETKPFQPSENHLPAKVCLAKEPIHSGNIFLYHKTKNREVYESARRDFTEFDDVLLYNERGELTEFTIGNLVVDKPSFFAISAVLSVLASSTTIISSTISRGISR